MRSMARRLMITLLLLLPILCAAQIHAFAIGTKGDLPKQKKDEEVLTPLTEEERSLNPRDLILHQPDFVGDLTFFVGEGFGGYGGAERLARKGNRYREESQFWIFVGELGKPSARVFPDAKAYDDFESPRGGSADSTPLNPQAFALEADTIFTSLERRRSVTMCASRSKW